MCVFVRSMLVSVWLMHVWPIEQNSSGLTVTLSDYGAMILSVTVPRKDGQDKELTLNYWDAPNVEAWAKLDSPYYGVVAGLQ